MKSIRTHLTLRLLIGGALLLGAAGVALHWQIRRALTGEFDHGLRATAQSLATLTEQSDVKVILEYSGEDMPQFERANGAQFFLLRELDGKEIARSVSLGTATLPMRAGTAEAPAFFDATLPDGRSLRCAGLRFRARDEEDEVKKRTGPNIEAVLIVGSERRPLDDTLATLRNSLLFVGIGALTALLALVRWGVRGGLAPLDRLGENVAAVSADSLETRFASETLPAELRPIAGRLNELLARLESAFARERRFTATAAHELRTPIAELRTLAEVNLTTPADETERVESWRDALATTLRMEALALRLLELARAETPARILHREPVPLAAAFAAAWQPWAARAAERGIVLESTLPPDLTADSDPALLAVILGNLCANAAEHAPAGSPFHVRATLHTRAVTLHFHNHAGDIIASDIPHLFERFWRKDTARADSRHHGLGLPLAAEFAALLGGRLTVHLSKIGDLEFALHLSARPDHSGSTAASCDAEEADSAQSASPNPPFPLQPTPANKT